MTKQPATPLLPFRSEFGEGHAYVVDATNCDVATIKRLGTPQEESDIAAYIAHACNAYPELVAALRKVLTLADAYVSMARHDLTPVQTDARALLAKLGEGA